MAELSILNHSGGIECPHCGAVHGVVVEIVPCLSSVRVGFENAAVFECQACFGHYWNHISTADFAFELGDSFCEPGERR